MSQQDTENNRNPRQKPHGENPQDSGGKGPQKPHGENLQDSGGKGPQKPHGENPQESHRKSPQKPHGENLQESHRKSPQKPHGENLQESHRKSPQKPHGENLQELEEKSREVVILYNQGRYKEALPLAEQLCDQTRQLLGEDNPVYAARLNNLAALCKATHNYLKAEQLYLDILDIYSKLYGEINPESIMILHNLSRCYHATGRYGEMERLLHRALDIAKQSPQGVDPDHIVQCLNTLADVEAILGRYNEAEKHLSEAGEIAENELGGDSAGYAQTLNNLAVLYIDLGRHIEAGPLLEKVLEITGSGPDGGQNIYYARTLHTLAGVRARLNNRMQAMADLEKAYSIKSSLIGEEDPDTALTMTSMAGLLTEEGRYGAAEPLYNRAIGIYEKRGGPDAPRLPPVLNLLAGLLHETGDLSGAESNLKRAISIEKSLGRENTLNFAHHLNNLALVYIDKGSFDKAEELVLQSLKIRKGVLGDNSHPYATTLNNIAGLYREMGNRERSEQYLRNATDIQRASPDQSAPGLAQSLANLALLLQERGNYGEAEPLHKEALIIRTGLYGRLHPSVSQSVNNLALLYAATGREKEALEQKWLVEEINDRLIGEVFSTGSEQQRMDYLENFRGLLYSFLTLVAGYFRNVPEEVNKAFDLVIRRKALGAEVLGVQRDAVLGGRYPGLQPQMMRLNALRAQITGKMLEGPGPEGIDGHRRLLNGWVAEKEILEKELARQVPEMHLEQKLQSANRKALAEKLPKKTALIEFVRIHTFDFKALPAKGERQWKQLRYLAFILHAGKPDDIRLVDLGDSERIDGLLAGFRDFITGGNKPPGKGKAGSGKGELKGEELYRALFEPLISYLDSCTHLFLSPDGDLSRLPFEVLPSAAFRRLIDDYRISYLTTGRDLLHFDREFPVNSAGPLVIADPDFDLGMAGRSIPAIEPRPPGRQSRAISSRGLRFSPLPGTRREGETVAARLGVLPWLKENALEGRLKTIISPRILHIATHGFFLEDQEFNPRKGDYFTYTPFGRLSHGMENPMLRSGLALAGANTWLSNSPLPAEAEDAILNAADVSGLDLSGTELVVLSACETGLGMIRAGEGVIGLRRSFVLAGARTLVMSLWKVPDRQTQELMEEFYRLLLAGENRAEALREAQLAMQRRYPGPFYWGAFICQGYPGPLNNGTADISTGITTINKMDENIKTKKEKIMANKNEMEKFKTPWPSDHWIQGFKEIVTAILGLLILSCTLIIAGLTLKYVGEPDKIANAKDLLQVLLGIAGVVVGYYFGRVPADARAVQAQEQADVATAHSEEVSARSQIMADEIDQVMARISRAPGVTRGAGDKSAGPVAEANLQKIRDELRNLAVSGRRR